LGSDMETFNSKAAVANRRDEINNAIISVGTLIPNASNLAGFERIERSFAHPDSEGAVPRVDFVNIEKDTIAYVVIGQQYDLWLARGVSDTLHQDAISYMEKMVERDLFDEVLGLDKAKLVQHLQVVYQGEERYAFRKPLKIFTEFEPAGKTIPRSPDQLGVSGNAAEIRKARNSANVRDSLKKANSKASLGGKQLSAHFSEFCIEVEGKVIPSALTTDNLLFAGAGVNRRDFYNDNNGNGTNFWTDIKPVKQRNLFGVFDPNSEDYAAPTKLRMAMHDVGKVTDFQYLILEHENLEIKERKDLLMRAKHEPSLLLGWQIEIDEGLYSGFYVVVGIKKTKIMRKTLFHVLAKDRSEHWLDLRRGNARRGLFCRPLRPVAIVGPPISAVPDPPNDDGFNDVDDKADEKDQYES